MSQSVWGYWMITLGIGVLTTMMLVQNYTTINQEDYYLLKEVTQAAMADAIDYNHYRQYGELKINREKFIENFERRFAESVKGNKNYQTDFYEIYETPPKVSVKVSTNTSSFTVQGDTMDLDVTNSIDAIIENNSTNTITKTFYSVPYGPCIKESQDALGYCTITNSPILENTGIKSVIVKELQKQGINVTTNDLEIVSSTYLGQMTTQEEFQAYDDMFADVYASDRTTMSGLAGNDAQNKSFEELIANEITDVTLTVTDKDVLAWSGKFKCFDPQGFSVGSYERNADGSHGNSIAGACLIGIKYELKFSY